MIRTRILGSALLAMAMMATACSPGGQVGADPETTTTTIEREPLAAPSLTAFDACESFLDYVIAHAVEQVGPYGIADPYSGWWGNDGAFFRADAAQEATAPGGNDGSPDFSGSNGQVLGGDEPDMVKTDGDRIVLLSGGTLIVADVTGDTPVITGRLHLGSRSVTSLFLSGDKVLLFGSSWTQFHPLVTEDSARFAPTYQSPSLELIEIDLTGDPEIVRTMTIDGRFVSGRMVGDTVRIVSASNPVGLEWSHPEGTGLQAEREATERNREIVRNSEPENWIPYYITTDGDGRITDEGTLFDCTRATHPVEFSGLEMLSVVTIDLSDGLDVIDSTGVLATGTTVYASAENLYVATQDWDTWSWRIDAAEREPDTVTTSIHQFDISDPATTTYVATGDVEGYLLNQFAMDEHEGLLRVASTTRPAWWDSNFESESLVTVLEAQPSGEMETVGRVDGLGKTEQIYSVRFMGDMAYVVTFRQTDPLYTLDLSDPTSPEVVGELKILGYSAYLHPVGEGLLLGVGPDATEDGRVQGTQVSLFDVSDPANPTRVDQLTLSEGSNSNVEYDHHAFLYWDPAGLAVIPITQWWWDDESEEVFLGALGIEVGDDSLTEL